MPQVVVITGASAGVGRALAHRVAGDGARLGLIARNAGRLNAAVGEVQAAGGTAIACPADVADHAAVEQAAERVEAELGPIDIWVNVGMATIFAPFREVTADEFRRATEVTYLGFVHGTMAALKRMQPRDRGTIVQVGSALAYRSIPLQSAYCGAKHAIVGFTDSVRSELIHDGSRIQLSVVHLPAVNTPQFDWGRNKMPQRPQPLPPIYQPEFAAEAIHHAALHPRREMLLGWPTIQAIIGQKLAPGYLDRMMARKAYGGQQSDEPATGGPDNLFQTVDGEYGAHGRFDAVARAPRLELWVAKHPRAAIAILALLVLALLAILIAVLV
jgi:NAD(P)-dependent dehydrogenase (short-subunit alcohol dehydrogenase family)